ncbi:MAG: hypothetical protein WAU68_16970 [Vitreimonas sp.]
MLQPVVAWAISLAISVGVAVVMAAHAFSLSLWWSAEAIVAIPSALWALLGIWITRHLNLWRPLPDILGAVALSLLLASNWAPLPIVLIAGVVAGLSYWLLAGLPRPPYASVSAIEKVGRQS